MARAPCNHSRNGDPAWTRRRRPHALLHLGTGVAGLRVWSDRSCARRHLRLRAALHGARAACAWPRVPGPGRIHVVMGMALDPPGNAVHTL
ncbi:MAG TPA: hypothetical protein VHG51_04390 [Longimicrobiaceae bacterium]|nr:hypothetical protein [Longimicrobiaceae bacterium]